jgi:hypothetical protein
VGTMKEMGSGRRSGSGRRMMGISISHYKVVGMTNNVTHESKDARPM